MATLDEQIAAIEEKLNSGVAEAIVDGQKVRLDLRALERRLAQLKAKKQGINGAISVDNTMGSALGD